MNSVILDSKDRQLLQELDTDCRKSVSFFSRKVNLSKGAVSYLMKQLEETEVISGYQTIIDSSVLGYFVVRVYLRFQFMNPESLEKVTSFFFKSKNTFWVGTARGKWDFAVLCWTKSTHDFKKEWDHFLHQYRLFVREMDIKMYTGTYHYPASYFLNKRNSSAPIQITGQGTARDFDEKDQKILELLSSHARMPTVELAQKTGLSPMIVQYRIKKLRQEKIILGFRAMINHNVLGFTNFKVDFYLNQLTNLEKIRNLIAAQPQTLYFDETIGGADLEAELICASQQDFEKVLNVVQQAFSKDINHVDYLVFPHVFKMNYFPNLKVEKSTSNQ